MSRRRAALAVSVFSLLTLAVIAVVTPVRAQTDTDDARRAAEDAAADAEGAFEIVDAAVAERAAIESQLFDVLDRYQANAERLAETWETLDRLNDTLAIAEARQESTRDSFETQAVAAYMSAVGSSAVLVIDSSTIESAMVKQETLGRTTRETLALLDGFLAFRDQVDEIRVATAARADETAAVQADLDADAAELEALFAAANAEVSAAYKLALEAEARLASATEALRAAQEANTTVPPATNPPRQASTTSTAPGTSTTQDANTSTSSSSTSTTAPASTTSTTSTTAPPSTTTTAPASWPPIPINSATYGWRPLIERHFASDLVLDALVIVQCESLGDPDAVNPYSGASGLFQFMPGTWAVASVEAGVGDRSVFDGEANIIAASWLAEYYRSRGHDPWRPWSCRTFL